jgi:DNA replication ATP-dependent helicase Dna2
MFAVNVLLEKLLEGRSTGVPDAGVLLLDHLSESRLDAASFLNDPLLLVSPPYSSSRYLAQITLRALQNDYDSVDDVVSGIQALLERNPPTLEPGRPRSGDRTVIPEARVVDLRYPAKKDEGHWESGVVALVTSGPLRGREIDIHLSSAESRAACLLVPLLWIHATVAIYNIEPAGDGWFNGCRETFLIIEPMRQVNATTVARALHCTKPQLDQIRRGKGDTTIPTLKGTLVHALFDRLLDGDTDLESMYAQVLPKYLVQLAAVVDESFDEDGFRADVLRHAAVLCSFVDANPHLRHGAQAELKRFSATIGIQGRIDAVFRQDNRIHILELKTGSRLRDEDHAQLFIYRLLLSDLARRWQRTNGRGMEISAMLLSSADGANAPLEIQTDFIQILDARNKILATHYALGHEAPHFRYRYEGFNEDVCKTCVSWTRKRCREATDLFGDRPDAEASPRLDYFRRFTRLVELERWATDEDLADLLDDSRLETRKKNFRTLTDARFVADGEPFTFEFDHNSSDLAAGDAILIHSGNISSTPNYHGYIRSIDAGHLRVSIPIKNLDGQVFSENTWIIDRLPFDVTTEASHTALYHFLKSGDRGDEIPLPKGRVMDEESRSSPLTRRFAAPSPFGRGISSPLSPDLNASQREAVEESAGCSHFHLIWGPPGTGKTRVIPEIIRQIDGPVLLGAFTNTAVDKILLALLDADPAIRFLRIGRASDSPELAARLSDPAEYFSEDLAAKHSSVHSVRRVMNEARIVAATAHRACTMPYLRQRRFEMVIVDEAAQLTEPLTLGLILRGRRYVLVGDDRQLPPVVRTRGLAQSMFERLKQSRPITLLDTQYRMHPDIMSVSNQLFYDGRLRTGVTHEDRRPPDSRSVEFVSVAGASGPDKDSRRNTAEAEAVAQLVRRYADMSFSIGVVSPFRAQVALIRGLLQDVPVTVDTVERFQGGERDIMILSLVRAESSDFVFDERRFNVAITRARRKLIFVAHPMLFHNSRYEWLSTFAVAAG